MPDRPTAVAGLANYTQCVNWRREGLGARAEEVKREGWLFFKPDSEGSTDGQRTMNSGSAIEQVGEARRPNGARVPVGVSNGSIFWFDYDNAQWTSLASGLTTSGIERWQIVNIGADVVFNNGVDLPYVWRVGEASAVPLYELREGGIASVRYIREYNQTLQCLDVLEIPEASDLDTIMNGGTPYGSVTSPSVTQRVNHEIIWSNIGNARDFAATVPCDATATDADITLDYPVLSLADGDSVIVIGAGSAGGNLVTTISSGEGTTTLTLADAASTTVSGTTVLKATALSSIVGRYYLEDTGSAIVAAMTLQNRFVVYKEDAIFVGYYTGDLDEPFAYDRVYVGNRVPSFKWTLADVGGQYHLYAGDRHFYRFTLGLLEPAIDPVLDDCEQSLFFDVVVGEDQEDVWATTNPCTDEVFFFRNGGILAYDYARERASTIDGADDFTCAAVIQKPLANEVGDASELWLIFGDTDGYVVTYGRTSLQTLTMQRHGVSFESSWQTGIGDFGDSFERKIVRSWAPLISAQGASNTMTFHLYGTERAQQTVTEFESKTITDDDTPSLVPLHYGATYFSEHVECSANEAVRFHGRIWEAGLERSGGIDRGAE